MITPRAAPAAPSDDCGTLGITGDWLREFDVGLGETESGSVVSSHAEGELRPDFAGSGGQELSPSGKDDRPGDTVVSAEASQAAPGPDAGHCLPPGGSSRTGC
ncbi:MAG TPA: hypothetical protein VF956_09020 [Candidatus Dormibacteraeota bacterium]